jgi:uncharacterized protein YaaR (DUF327 family)
MRERHTNNQTQTTKMNKNAHKKSMKKLFTHFECQKENHREEKKTEIQKNFRNFYKSIDDSLTIRSLSAYQKSSIQKNLKNVEFNAAKCK